MAQNHFRFEFRFLKLIVIIKDCSSILQARIEFWMAGSDGEYKDDFRATLVVDDSGEYQFESHRPPSYSGRPPHIHMRETADGYKKLITPHYSEKGSSSSELDLVLIPDSFYLI